MSFSIKGLTIMQHAGQSLNKLNEKQHLILSMKINVLPLLLQFYRNLLRLFSGVQIRKQVLCFCTSMKT
jgi:hypothetical protein